MAEPYGLTCRADPTAAEPTSEIRATSNVVRPTVALMAQTRTTTDRTALVAAAVTVVLWSSAFVSIRAAGPHYSPGALALGRLAAGSVVLVVILLIKGEGLPVRTAWPGILVSGVLWFGVYMVALNWGE